MAGPTCIMAGPDRPSPFTAPIGAPESPGEPPGAALVPAAAAPAATASERVHETTSQLAWEEACEEACEAPQIAGEYSCLLSGDTSFRLSHPRASGGLVVEPQQAAELKADEAAPAGWPAWRAEAAKLLVLAWPIAVSAAWRQCPAGKGFAWMQALLLVACPTWCCLK